MKPEDIQVDKSSNGVALGPISLSFGTELNDRNGVEASTSGRDAAAAASGLPSIHSMTTAEWRELYEKDGTNDLWMEDEFNAGSRLMVGTVVRPHVAQLLHHSRRPDPAAHDSNYVLTACAYRL